MGQEGGLYLTLHCHRQNDSRMKMGSSEGHFNVLSIARDQSHATDSVSAQATTFQVRGEPERNRTEVLLLTSTTPYRWAKPASRWGQSHATGSVSAQTTTFEVRGEPKRNRTEVLLLTSTCNALPLGQTFPVLHVHGPVPSYHDVGVTLLGQPEID